MAEKWKLMYVNVLIGWIIYLQSVPLATAAPPAPPAAQTRAPSPADSAAVSSFSIFKFGRIIPPFLSSASCHKYTLFPWNRFHHLQDLGTVSGSLKAPEVTQIPGFEATFGSARQICIIYLNVSPWCWAQQKQALQHIPRTALATLTLNLWYDDGRGESATSL